VVAWKVDLIRNTVHTAGPVARFVDTPERVQLADVATSASTVHPEDRDRVWPSSKRPFAQPTPIAVSSASRCPTMACAGSRPRAMTPAGQFACSASLTTSPSAGWHRTNCEQEQAFRDLLKALPAAAWRLAWPSP